MKKIALISLLFSLINSNVYTYAKECFLLEEMRYTYNKELKSYQYQLAVVHSQSNADYLIDLDHKEDPNTAAILAYLQEMNHLYLEDNDSDFHLFNQTAKGQILICIKRFMVDDGKIIFDGDVGLYQVIQ